MSGCARSPRKSAGCLLAAAIVSFAACPGAAQAQALTFAQATRIADAAGAPLSREVALEIARQIPPIALPEVPWDLLSTERAGRLHVRLRYLDTVLVDLEEAALGEQVALAYGRWRQASARNDLAAGQVLALEARYRDLFDRRAGARVRQRSARTLLAIAMRTPASVPAEIVDPGPETNGHATAPADAPDALPPTLSTRSVRRAHARMLALAGLEQSRGPSLQAARKRLEAAEAALDEQRDAFTRGATSELELGDAMAQVAEAQLAVRTVEAHIAVLADLAGALAEPLP